jgi:hypothetical protein
LVGLCHAENIAFVRVRSSPRGEYVADRLVPLQDVAAVYRHLGIDSTRVALTDAVGRPIYVTERGSRQAAD